MEPEAVKRGRGRKRKRKNEKGAVEKSAKNGAGRGAGRSTVLVGRYVKKEFDDSGEFLGKIVSYDSGLYRVDYEDGDCEDLETREVKGFLVEEAEMDAAFHKRRKALDSFITRKYNKLKAAQAQVEVPVQVQVPVQAQSVGNTKVENVVSDELVKGDDKVENVKSVSVEFANGDKVESSSAQADVENESSSDVSDDEPLVDVVEVEIPLVPPPELPPSSGNIAVPEEHVSYLLSVYSFLRSFSVCLFLSPFGLDEFVGALNSTVHNTLLDSIHVALVRTLKSHVENLSSEGSEVAAKCLRSMDWSLLDSLTWPMFIVQYLTTMRYAEGPEWKEFYVTVLEKDYCTLSAGRKLTVLQILCDDASNSAELRAEIDNREESEFGLDPDRDVTPVEIIPKTNESVRRKGRPRKNPDQEDVSESHKKAISSAPNAVVSKPTNGADVDEDGNGDECRLCGMDGTLICCDGCPSSYHSRCIGVMKMFIPQGDWFCPECTINRSGPKVTNTTSLRGAEYFGIDPYEQVFLGSCDHLLVIKTSRSSELHARYYSPVDVLNVVNALTCSAEHRKLYMEICKGILQYWEIPEHVFSLAKVEIDEKLPNKDGEQLTLTLMDKGSDNVADAINTGNVDGVGELSLKDAIVTLPEEKCKELVEVKDSHQPYQQVVEDNTHLGNSTDLACVNVEPLACVKVEPSSLSGNLSVKESAVCIYENGNCNNESNMAYYTKQATLLFGGRAAGGWLYNGSSFKAQAYVNTYAHGDFAASAAASLAILSSEEKPSIQAESSINHRKFMSANYTLQAKAFALAAKRFYWPNYERKLFEVPRERCGWCVACQANINSRRGCYLNSAFSNAIKSAAKILSTMQPSKNVEGSLASIATYVLFMEESLRGLTVGPFVTGNYRNHWRKLVEEATTLKEIKAFLLEFERSIRDIAFSADWIRLVDDIGVENQATQNAKTVVGSTQKRGQGRRGRKPPPVVISEITETDGKDSSSDIAWWRGGLLSKHIFQKGVLPQKMLKHAARQGGCAIINSVQYIDGLEVPKRSRQFIWRAAVDMSKTASQLALQVRYLDLHVRWNELVCPEQPLQDGKGPESEASAFRNACIVDKKIVGNKISYGVIFENQKHLPSRVLKKVLEVEETEDKKEKNWFVETHIPLYLIKDYEKKVAKTVMPSAAKHVSALSSLGRKKFKAPGKNIFSFLVQKRDNMGKCLCTSCQLDVSFRVSAKCSACQGYCHEQCAVGSRAQTAGKIELITTCKKCYVEKVATPQREIVGDSPTSPLLLRGQESQQPTKIVIKLGKQSSFQKPIEYTNQSSQKKNPPSNLSNKSKSGKKIDQKKHLTGSGYQSYEKKPKKKINPNGSISNSKASKYCLGLIWKKRNPSDTGIDFRLRNILMKNNPNGHLLAPKCQLCSQPYNKDLMYICCEKCKSWFHADSVELQESRLMELFGFKCSRCRRIRIPICPYTDPEERKKLESRKAALEKAVKGRYMDTDSELDSNDDLDSEPDSAPAYDSVEAGDVQEENPYDSYLMADQVNHQRFEMDFEPPVSVSGPVSKKLAVRRHIKSEKESDGISENNPAWGLPANNLNSAAGESSTPIVEWNVSSNGFEDNMMFDYGDLNYEDMEFEPQTYFSFNELLVADDGVQTDKGDRKPPGDMTEKVVNPSAPAIKPEQFQMDVTYDQQEPMFSVESGLEMVPCRVCSQADPIPDLFCQTCGLWLHQHCSPWEEDSSWDPEIGWKCGNCRDWC